MTMELASNRREELEQRLDAVGARIRAAANAAGRNPADVSLLAITKTRPTTDIKQLADLGVAAVGENKAQELVAKHESLSDLVTRWHFVGQLQRNKIKSIVSFVDTIQSVDRTQLVRALSVAASERDRNPINCLIQVDLDPESTRGRGGVRPEGVAELAELIALSPALNLSGVMGVASQADTAEASFERLAAASDVVRQVDASATTISAGMSGDFESAIAAGSTQVRLGAALLGPRSIVR